MGLHYEPEQERRRDGQKRRQQEERVGSLGPRPDALLLLALLQ